MRLLPALPTIPLPSAASSSRNGALPVIVTVATPMSSFNTMPAESAPPKMVMPLNATDAVSLLSPGSRRMVSPGPAASIAALIDGTSESGPTVRTAMS